MERKGSELITGYSNSHSPYPLFEPCDKVYLPDACTAAMCFPEPKNRNGSQAEGLV